MLLNEVDAIRNEVNSGHWDRIRQLGDKLVLVHVFLQFIKGVAKPIISNEELIALGDVSVSSVIDHAHMGFLTIFADFIGTLVFYRKNIFRIKDLLESAS
jgi:hypothetical protein